MTRQLLVRTVLVIGVPALMFAACSSSSNAPPLNDAGTAGLDGGPAGHDAGTAGHDAGAAGHDGGSSDAEGGDADADGGGEAG
jgi:hypothetical protein